jgi:UDP-glucose 4-epimerase
MRNKKILITGGAGFIGRNLAEELSKTNEVVILDKVKVPYTNSIVADIRKTGWFKKVKKVDYIFHLSAIVGVDYVATHPDEVISTEIAGLKNIVEFAKKRKAKRIIYSSTSSVYEAPDSPTSYNIAKLLAEQYLGESGLNYSIIRYFNVYGKHQRKKMVISRFINNALKGEPIIVFGNGNQTRDFTFIGDAIKATVLIAKSKNTSSCIIDVGTGVETKLIDVARLVKEIHHSKSEIIHKKAPNFRKNFEVRRRVSDPSKLKKLVGFECKTSLKEGIGKTINSSAN